MTDTLVLGAGAAGLMWLVHLPPYERAERAAGNVITSILAVAVGLGAGYLLYGRDPLEAGEPGRYEGVTVVLRDPDGNVIEFHRPPELEG